MKISIFHIYIFDITIVPPKYINRVMVKTTLLNKMINWKVKKKKTTILLPLAYTICWKKYLQNYEKH